MKRLPIDAKFVEEVRSKDDNFVRYLFAAFAMNALVSDGYDSSDREEMAEEAWLIADTMMDTRDE